MPGGVTEASAEYRTALGLNPNLADAQFGLAALLSDMAGQRAEAVAEYRETLRIRPDSLEAHANLEAGLRARPDVEPVKELLARLKAGR